MGAADFRVRVVGTSAQDAFNNAIDDALYENGNNGYTGTIAEKHRFVMIHVPPMSDPEEYAELLIDMDDVRIRDKHGPAGCIFLGRVDKDLNQFEYLFFGFASS